jgi:4-hydroxythreonine-4-phosphate dehydrogenase
MIYVSQGHERGIGLEVFLKAALQLPSSLLDIIEIHANQEDLKETAATLGFDLIIDSSSLSFSNIRVKYKPVANGALPNSTLSLNSILKIIGPSDILITLPTSKDQLIFQKTICAGYTEFFRSYYHESNLSMLFHANNLDVLLITDHIPLKEVVNEIRVKMVIEKVRNSIDGLEKYFRKPTQVIFSGINPHAGENGILGSEDSVITDAIEELSHEYREIDLVGPLPGDTLHFHRNPEVRQLWSYSYHDQGLPFFKEKFGLFGINVTLGLPFLRLSVDHGTAFSLYGTNSADCSGLLHVLYTAYEVLNK